MKVLWILLAVAGAGAAQGTFHWIESSTSSLKFQLTKYLTIPRCVDKAVNVAAGRTRDSSFN